MNMRLLKMESARTLEEALRLANQSGSPAQNFVVADDRGRIAWTILGRIPRRVGFDGRLPSSWADGTRRWDGYLEPEEYPRIVESRVGATLDGQRARRQRTDARATWRRGLRSRRAAQQIRDDLLALENATEADMLRIQLDDRALFLERWQKLLLETLNSEAVKADPRRAQLRQFV